MTKQLILLDDNNNKVQASIEDVVTKQLNKFKGWVCDTGVQSLYIDFDGKVWVGNCASAFAKNPNVKSTWGFLGTIDQNFELPKNSVVCPFEGCGCGSDIIVTKYRQQDEQVVNFIDKNRLRFTSDISETNSIKALKLYYPVKKQILWDVSRRCNYDCSYCWPGVHNLTDPHRPLDQFKKTADYLIENWSEGEQIRWYFGGGEPTLNPDFELFVDYLASKNQWTMLVTNASQGPQYWSKNAENYNVLVFSAHFEFLKKNVFTNNFATVAEKLRNKDSRLSNFIIKLMTKPTELQKSINFVNELKLSIDFYDEVKDRILFDMVPLRDTAGFKILNYSDSELEKIVQFNKKQD